MKIKLIFTFVILLLFITLPLHNPVQVLNSQEVTAITSTNSSPIIINNNDDLLVFPGNGTTENPFRIEGYSIISADSLPCISIGNTTLWVLIYNCTLSNSTSSAIELNSLENVIVQNVSCFNTVNGIRINSSTNVTIENCTIKNSDLGVVVINSEHCQIFNNNILECTTGVHLSGTSEIRVSHNYIRDITSQGIYIDNNLNLVDNNTLVNNTVGVELRNANSNMIYQNAFFNCSYGVFSIDSMYCDISNNTFMDIKYGVYLYQGNAGYSISWNAFLPNGELTVFDDMPENHFFYNFYWDYDGSDLDNDGIGDTPYAISGSGNNQDVSPLMNPPGYTTNDTRPPKVYWTQPFEKIEYGVEMYVNPTIIDVNGVESAVLSFNNGTDQWFNISMTNDGIRWQAIIPAYSFDIVIVYRIFSCDKKGNWGTTGNWSYSVVPDANAPFLLDSEFMNDLFVTVASNSKSFTFHTFMVDVIDKSDITYVIVHYRLIKNGITFDNNTVSLGYSIIYNAWRAVVEFKEAVNRYEALFQYEAADIYGNVGFSPSYEIIFIGESSTTTMPHSSAFSSISIASLSITGAIIIVLLIMEIKEKLR